jgi:c-di-GMP-binding flagellar brake protein YcgR
MEEEVAQEDLAACGRERRMMPRCALDEEAMLLLVGRGDRVRCRIVELSLSGCRMSLTEHLPAGSGTRVEATFKVQGIVFRFGGSIEWADHRNLVGIRFVELPTRRRDELIEVLRELEAQIAAKREREAIENQAEEERARQEAERQAKEPAEPLPFLDQLWAAPLEVQAKQLPDPVPAFQPGWPVAEPILAPVPLPVSSSEPQPQPPAPAQAPQRPAKNAKRERRTQSRHEVDTTAVIFLINVGSKLSGRILDLSVGGCRIRTDERFPVGIYTRVETEFLLEGLPFRLGGVIQAIHDRNRLLIGIRFLDVSARKREQLEQLIQEIEQMQREQGPARTQDSGAMDAGGPEPENSPQVPVAS